MKRYVWLNLINGQFSNSWNEEDMLNSGIEGLIKDAPKESGWKLIEYECKNDEDFSFSLLMKIR